MKQYLTIFILILLVGTSVLGIALAIDRGVLSSVDDEEIDLSQNALIHQPSFDSAIKNDSSSVVIPSIDKTPRSLDSTALSFPFVMPDGVTVRAYNTKTGVIREYDLFRLSESKQVATIHKNASNLTWSNDGKKVIASIGSDFFQYDLFRGSSLKIPTGIFSPIFTNDSGDIAHLVFDEAIGEGSLRISDGKFSSFNTLMKTRLKSWSLESLDQKTISLLITSTENQLDNLFLFNISKKELSPILQDQRDIHLLWAPDGSSLIFSRTREDSTELLLLKPGNSNATILQLSVSAKKCAWGSIDMLYCAVTSQGTGESIVKMRIDLTNSQASSPVEIISASSLGGADVRDLMIAANNSMFVFRDARNGKIFKIDF